MSLPCILDRTKREKKSEKFDIIDYRWIFSKTYTSAEISEILSIAWEVVGCVWRQVRNWYFWLLWDALCEKTREV